MEQTRHIYHVSFFIVAVYDIKWTHDKLPYSIAMSVTYRNWNVARSGSGDSFKEVECTKNSLKHSIRLNFEKIALESF